MIKKSVTSKFKEFDGEVCYSGSAFRGDPFYLDPPYGLGDIRQVNQYNLLSFLKYLFPFVRKYNTNSFCI